VIDKCRRPGQHAYQNRAADENWRRKPRHRIHGTHLGPGWRSATRHADEGRQKPFPGIEYNGPGGKDRLRHASRQAAGAACPSASTLSHADSLLFTNHEAARPDVGTSRHSTRACGEF